MKYHIYLDGEVCGVLTEAQYALARREARANIRTWWARTSSLTRAIAYGAGLYFRAVGAIAGLGVVAGMALAPDMLAWAQQHGAQEIAVKLKFATPFLVVPPMGGIIVAAMLRPREFTRTNVFETELGRRVREMKQIRRHGQLEILGFTPEQQDRGQ